MSAKKEQDEPTMEEILASIRRIISEEGEPEQAPAPRPVMAEAEADDILELTEVIEEDFEAEPENAEDTAISGDFSFDEPEPEPAAADLRPDAVLEDEPGADFDEDFSLPTAEDAPQTEPEPEPEFAPIPAPAPRPAASEDDDGIDAVDPADATDAIMSEFPADQVQASFGQLSDLIVAGYAGADKTLEGMVREMLKPMLKTWLDQNLPQIVERTVAREIARLARVKKP